MSKNKQLTINLITTIFVLLVNIIINFGLSKYIVSTIGESAYGFVSLATNFVSYATIFTTILNSMANRFISIDIHNKKYKSANEFFNSVLFSNIIIVTIFIIPSFIFILFLEHFFEIPIDIILDIKILFSLIFINYFINLIGNIFTVSTYAKNKLYLSSLRNMESSIIKVFVIILLFLIFNPNTFYIGIGTLIASLYITIFNIHYTKKLLPKIKLKKEYISLKKIKTLISSGIWNSITSLGNVLADGLDLLITNLFINASTMGIVALAKIPSGVINMVISNISNVFQPQIVEYYANKDYEKAKNETIKSMKISGICGNIPFCYIVIFGSYFCSLWMPTIELKLLSILCIITFINVFTGGLILPLYNIFTICNKTKWNAFLNIGSGFISFVLVLIILKFTNLGVYAIVGVSAIVGLLNGFILVPLFASKSLNVKLSSFYGAIFRYIISTFVILIMFYIINIYLIPNNWIEIIISILVCSFIGFIINYLLFLNKSDRKNIFCCIKKLIFK